MIQEYSIAGAEGTAKVECQGLYYQIRCLLHTTKPCRVRVCGSRGEANLGLTVPVAGGFGLETRIPIKRLGEGSLEFSTDAETVCVPVNPDEPCDYIRFLMRSKLAQRDGKTVILLPRVAHRAISRPTGQWSEPKTSE